MIFEYRFLPFGGRMYRSSVFVHCSVFNVISNLESCQSSALTPIASQVQVEPYCFLFFAIALPKFWKSLRRDA